MEQQQSRRALTFILLAILIDTIGFAIVMPVLPEFLAELTGSSISEAARDAGWLLVTFAGLQFISGPILGNLSDRYGRRPILLISMAAFGVNYFLMALAPNLAWLFVGRAIAGVAGAIYAPANAYIADITEPAERARRFAYIGAAFGFGFILGPAIGGLLGHMDVRAPFYAAGAMALLNFVFGLFVLPESLPEDRRRAFNWRRANPLSALLVLRRYGNVLPLIGVAFLFTLAFHVYPATWSFYTSLRFEFSPAMIGVTLAYTGLFMALVQGLVVGRAVKRLGEARSAIAGMSFAIAGMAAYVFAGQAWMIFAIGAIGSLQALAGPSINALLSTRVAANEQGALQGGIASVNGLGAIIGPLIFTQAIAAATVPGAPHPFPGAAFALSSGICLMALIVFVLAERKAAAPAPAA